MSDYIHTVQDDIWEAMSDREYRDAFTNSHISTSVAAQMLALREAQGWTQDELAERAGMSQARISVMENPSYSQYTLTTLKRLRAAYDVALVVRFVPFSELARWATELTPEKLAPPSFAKDHLNTEPSRQSGISGVDLPSAAEAARQRPADLVPSRGAQVISLEDEKMRRNAQEPQGSSLKALAQ